MKPLRNFASPLLAALLLAACSSPGGVTAPPVPTSAAATVPAGGGPSSTVGEPSATPTLQAAFSRQQAIDAAITQARGDQINAPQEDPHDPQAELMTVADAYQRLAMQAYSAPGQSQAEAVWLVTLQGSWSSGASTPAEPYHHYWVILDANTGALVTYTVGP